VLNFGRHWGGPASLPGGSAPISLLASALFGCFDVYLNNESFLSVIYGFRSVGTFRRPAAPMLAKSPAAPPGQRALPASPGSLGGMPAPLRLFTLRQCHASEKHGRIPMPRQELSGRRRAAIRRSGVG